MSEVSNDLFMLAASILVQSHVISYEDMDKAASKGADAIKELLTEKFIQLQTAPTVETVDGDVIQCPKCGKVQEDSIFDLTDSGDMEGEFPLECTNCNETFIVEFEYRAIVITRPI